MRNSVGVFPEVASRRHIEVISPVVNQALEEAHMGLEDIDCIAVTRGPGLVGSLLVGNEYGQRVGDWRAINHFLGINHIEGTYLFSLADALCG